MAVNNSTGSPLARLATAIALRAAGVKGDMSDYLVAHLRYPRAEPIPPRHQPA